MNEVFLRKILIAAHYDVFILGEIFTNSLPSKEYNIFSRLDQAHPLQTYIYIQPIRPLSK